MLTLTVAIIPEQQLLHCSHYNVKADDCVYQQGHCGSGQSRAMGMHSLMPRAHALLPDTKHRVQRTLQVSVSYVLADKDTAG